MSASGREPSFTSDLKARLRPLNNGSGVNVQATDRQSGG